MNGSRRILTTLSTFVLKAKNNPDFAAAIVISYGLMAWQIVLQIFLVPLYLQTFDAYRFGALMILVGYAGFAFPLASSLYSVLLRLFGEAETNADNDQLSSLYVAAKLVFVSIGLICGLALLVVELAHPVLFDDAPAEIHGELIHALLLSIVHLLLLCELAVDQTLLASSQRQAAVNLVTIVGLATFSVSVVPALLLGADLIEVMGCFILGDVVSRVLAAMIVRRYFRIRWRQSFGRLTEAMRRIFRAQAWRYFSFTTMTSVLQADVILVGLIGGPLAAAKFVLVWKIAELLTLVLSRVTQHLQAEFVRMDLREEQGRLIRIYNELYGGLLAVALLFAILYSVFGQWIVGRWVGESAVPMEPWAYVLAGVTILWLGMARLPITVALSLNRMTPLLRLVGSELAAKLLLIFLLFPHADYLAPMIAISLVHVCGVAYGYYALGRGTLARLGDTTP